MKDSSKGLNITKNVQRVVAKSAWGAVVNQPQNEAEPYAWQLAHD